MYFVDRKKIEQTLQCLEQVTTVFSQTESYETQLQKYALERMAHLMIDAVLDVGNALIDGFIMRDPGSYEDIIDILMDEKVVSTEEGGHLKDVVRLRKMLVQEYITMDHEHVLRVLKDKLSIVQAYPKHVRRYLEQELGPVSAFSNS
ncbi:DUF86 domain-containing protein [Ectobacillus sp. JY-23]|uniref:DUF86 domain-containing protein n=1 Tax=Ectobacillus sp. JY-23 TaxID=2933872 RepID=UPI001FF33B66|nr:DUF86 domain-containing protein [Ectobacillus sp. JY-23]UOY90983.1 DUF86 domain-containing protein [Ectobacillus sp. JY-23]